MRVRKIKGDGNCFFCCISYVITGDEGSHEQVRQMACSYNEDSESTVLCGNNQTGLQYLSASKMKNAGAWGTIDEILANANLLQLTILVQSPKSPWSTTCMAEECSKVTMVHDLHGRRMLQSHYGPRLAWQKNAPKSLWSTTCMAEECSKVTMVHDLHGRRMLHGRHQTPPLRFTWTNRVAATLRLSCQWRTCNLLAAC